MSHIKRITVAKAQTTEQDPDPFALVISLLELTFDFIIDTLQLLAKNSQTTT